MDERQESASLRHELELGMIEIARQSPKEPHKIVMGVSYSMAITVTGALFSDPTILDNLLNNNQDMLTIVLAYTTCTSLQTLGLRYCPGIWSH